MKPGVRMMSSVAVKGGTHTDDRKTAEVGAVVSPVRV
jgi:hypothetical protein